MRSNWWELVDAKAVHDNNNNGGSWLGGSEWRLPVIRSLEQDSQSLCSRTTQLMRSKLVGNSV